MDGGQKRCWLSHKIIWNTKVRYDLLRITMDSGDVVGTEPLELICIHQKTKYGTSLERGEPIIKPN